MPPFEVSLQFHYVKDPKKFLGIELIPPNFIIKWLSFWRIIGKVGKGFFGKCFANEENFYG